MTQKILFEIEDAEIVKESEDSHFATAKILAFSSDWNRHDMFCSEETLKNMASTIYEKPIVFGISNLFSDFGTHQPDPFVGGFVVRDSGYFEKLPDGRLGFFVEAKIWKKYSRQFLSFMKKSGNFKHVSVELFLNKARANPDGTVVMEEFEFAAVTVLGDNYTEASPDANIQMLSFAKEQEEYNRVYNFEFGKYEDIDFTIPENVKKNAKKGLESKSGSSVLVALAKFLVKNEKINPQRIRTMSKYLNRFKKSDSVDSVSLQLLGGSSAKKWIDDIVSKMDEKDKTLLSYFAESENQKKEVEQSMENKKQENMAVETDEKEKEEMAVETENQETPEEEKKEEENEEQEEKEEGEKEDMSLDANADVKAILDFLEEETEDYRSMQSDFACGKGDTFALMKFMYSRMCKMAEDMKQKDEENKTYMSENEELKKFKADMESEKFQAEVMSVMKEVENALPESDFSAMKEDAKNFSLENIDGWKNKVRALAFSYSKNTKSAKEDEKSEFVKFDVPQNDKKPTFTGTGSKWKINNK